MTPGGEPTDWRLIGAFLLLAFGWSWAFWLPEALVAEGYLESVPSLPALGAYGPSLAAFVLVTYENGRAGARRLARRAVRIDFPKRWFVPALLLSPAIVVGALAVAVVTDTTPSFPWRDNLVLFPITFVFVLLLGGPIQEEFGWRGFLVENLQNRFSALGTGVAVGLLWALWHLPLFFVPSDTVYYRNPFLGFVVSITLLSVLMTWVYNNTNGSLLPALLFHASFNWSQLMFPVIESGTGSLALVVLLAVTTLGVVAYWGPKRLVRSGG